MGFRRSRLYGYCLQEGWLDGLRPDIVRRELPLQTAYDCHPLPHVTGPTVSEYYEVIRLPYHHQLLFPLSEYGALTCLVPFRNDKGLPRS